MEDSQAADLDDGGTKADQHHPVITANQWTASLTCHRAALTAAKG